MIQWIHSIRVSLFLKKNLIVIIGSLNIGGTESHLAAVLPLLVARGWGVRLFTLSFPAGLLASHLESAGVRVTPLLNYTQPNNIKYLPHLLGRILRIGLYIKAFIYHLKQEEESILHFFLPEAYIVGMIGALLVQFKGPKLMSRRSLNHYQARRTGLGWCERLLHTQLSMALGNSQAVMEQLKAEKIPLDRLALIYNGINLAPFAQVMPRELCRQQLNIENDALVFIIVANLIPYKGHLDLLKALSLIKDRLPKNWRLVCVGRDDGIGNLLTHKTEEFGLSRHILWLGSRNDVPDLLSASNIGILCSHQEGFSNAILEGMAARLPMIVTDVGGNGEAVIHGVTGYVVPPKNPQALSQAILTLSEDPEKMKQFGQLAYARVKEKFSLDECVNAYITLYENCLLKKTKAGALCVD